MNAAIAEYVEVYQAALSRLEDEEGIDDKPALARRMTEAYFRGRLDRERIDRAIAARDGIAA